MPSTDEHNCSDGSEAERVPPAVALREAAATAQAAARAASAPRWLAGAWLAVFVVAMTVVAVATAARTLLTGRGWADTATTVLLFAGVGLFAVWVSGPVVMWLRARRRGVFPRHDPFLRGVSGETMSRRRLAAGAVLIGLSASGIGYWIAVSDSHGTHYGGQWALAGSILLGTTAVTLTLRPALVKRSR